MNKDFIDLYKIIDISFGATEEEIKKAYRKQAKIHHPDVGGNPETFKQVRKAYEILSDKTHRVRYDRIYQEYAKEKRSQYRQNQTNQQKHNKDEENQKRQEDDSDKQNDNFYEEEKNKGKDNYEPIYPKKNWRNIFRTAGIILACLLIFWRISMTNDDTNYNDSLPTSTSQLVVHDNKNVSQSRVEINRKDNEIPLEQQFKETEEYLNNTYKDYNLDEVYFKPFFQVSKEKRDDGSSIIVTFVNISKDGYEYLMQSNNMEMEILEILQEFFDKPKKVFSDEQVILLYLYDIYTKKPGGELYENADVRLLDNTFNVSQFIAAWDGSTNDSLYMNPDLNGLENITVEQNKNSPQVSSDTKTKTEEGKPQIDKNEHKSSTFTLGSTMDEVETAMGTPSSISYDRWSYDNSSVTFENRMVVGWSDISNNLKVSIGKKDPNAPPFTLGSTSQEVITAMGTPSSISYDRWSYDNSSVTFENRKVVGWSDISNNLKVSIGKKDPNATPFTLGSTAQEVIAAMGTPSSISYDRWSYDNSSVTFENRKVVGWSDISNNLKVSIGKKDPNASPFTLESTAQEVIAAMGTPSSISYDRWSYDNSSVTFKNGKVVGWSDISNNLKVK
jgi:curved DNA-binding protein CbpA